MNPLTKVKLIKELNEREADIAVAPKISSHSVYRDSAWIFLTGLLYELTEREIISVFYQYGEIVNINPVRDSILFYVLRRTEEYNFGCRQF
uniref:RRM domain-containing protein n=1 Tax=Prolemur simus TaxID=1328070 RepID=A0A8C8ZRV1_PROSS